MGLISASLKKLCSNPRHKDMPYTGFIEYTNVLNSRRALDKKFRSCNILSIIIIIIRLYEAVETL